MAMGKVEADKAYTRCDLELLNFETTEEISEFAEFAGQDRALEAVAFGIGIRHKGFNLFVNGPQGSRRHEIIQKTISEKAIIGASDTSSESIPKLVPSLMKKITKKKSRKGRMRALISR